jgi:hypothetical protein
MILHFLYIVAFTVLAVLAITNMIRNLMTLGMDSQRTYPSNRFAANGGATPGGRAAIPHPEFLDANGDIIHEPLLVMRSMTVEDAREQLDALYKASPGPSAPNRDTRDD